MAEDKEAQRLKLAVSEAVRRRLDQFSKHIPVVDGTDKSDLRRWLQGIDHANESTNPGDAMIIDMVGPLVTGPMALFIRTALKNMKDKQTWTALRTAIVNQYLGKGETRYWKNRVEKIKQDSGETVREYAGRFMYQVQQAYVPAQLSESVLTERLLNKFVQGISSRIIRGTVSMILEDELEKLEQRVRAEEQERRRVQDEEGEASTSRDGTADETGGASSRQCGLHHSVEGVDLQKMVDMAAAIAFGYEKDEEEEVEVAALPPPPPQLLQPEDNPQVKEMTGTFKSFQKDFRSFMSQQQDRTKKLYEEICALKEAQSYKIPVLPMSGGGVGLQQAGTPQIHNHHYGNWGASQVARAGPGKNNGGPGNFQCWACGQPGHLKRNCPTRNQGNQQPNVGQQNASSPGGGYPNGNGYQVFSSSQGTGQGN